MKRNLYKYTPILLLILINLLTGSLIVSQYSESWDEGQLYEYADVSLDAYSALLQNNFSAENHYGPTNHRYYGPAYLILGKTAITFLNHITQNKIPEIVFWHLFHFITLQIGLVFLYQISLRFVHWKTAIVAVALFSTQPLIWGHAFINPKDIPFMVFFLATISTGFAMADKFPKPNRESTNLPLTTINSLAKKDFSSQKTRIQKYILWTTVTILALFLLMILLSNPIQKWISTTTIYIYQANPGTLIGKAFSQLAVHADTIPVELYISKAIALFQKSKIILLLLSIVLVLTCLLMQFKSTGKYLFRNYVITPFKIIWRSPSFILILLLASILLGLSTSIRIIAPAAAAIVCLYFVIKHKYRSFPPLITYFGFALPIVYISWPFLWNAPINHFLEALTMMAQFPYLSDVLFNGTYYRADLLPASYLPVLLILQFTIPVILLFLIGLIYAFIQTMKRKMESISLSLIAAWFFIPFFLILFFRPTMYDNFRQVLFIIPPIFIFCGIGLNYLLEIIQAKILRYCLIIIILLPGIFWNINLHPYQYAYYNILTGGLSGAYNKFETDYWATSFKEIATYLNTHANSGSKIIASEPVHLLEKQLNDNFQIDLYPTTADAQLDNYDFAVATTRLNKDKYIFPDAKIIYSVGRQKAIYAVLKELNQP